MSWATATLSISGSTFRLQRRKREKEGVKSLQIGLMLLLLMSGAVACQQAPHWEDVTPLPTAVPPASLPAGEESWALGFRHEFPPDFWSTGFHRYAFRVECPVTGIGVFASEWVSFATDPYRPEQEGATVYLRLNGLSTEPFVPVYLSDQAIHPSQPTVAALYFLGLSADDAARAAETCTALIGWDNSSAEMVAMEPFQP